MRDVLTPPKASKATKNKGGEVIPFRFEIPLEKPMCDNTTKFSGWIVRRKPHLRKKILQCGAHLTGIAWQKKSQTRFFDDLNIYKRFYKLIVRCLRCSSTALATILQRKILEWLHAHNELRAEAWFEEYWTGERGNYMLAHAEVGGTNNNCGVEGGWNGVKKEVCGTAGSTSSLAVQSVVPSLLRFLGNKSKEEASYWRKHTMTRNKNMMFSFPSIPVPTKEEWKQVDSLYPNILELCTVFARPEVKAAWDLHIREMLQAAEEEGVVGSAAHVQIRALFHKKHTAKPPPRSNISYIIMPSLSLLKKVDADMQMTAVDCLDAIHEDMSRFDAMLSNPAGFAAHSPRDFDAEDYIGLHESFYLLEPLEERWGKWVSWKCMCESFFSNAICGHSALMSLLYDSTLEFPSEWSTQQLPSSDKKKKPSAWAEFHEEGDKPPRTERWAPRTLGGDDMVITRTLKVHQAQGLGFLLGV
jgi:hypothetical protein